MLAAALAWLLLAAGPPVSDVRVVKIVDGDSLWALTPEGTREEIRIAELDCPEKDQPHGDAARRELSGLVSRKYVRLERLEIDKYGRTVARVWVGDVNVTAELIRRGACRAYRKYLRDRSLLALEKEARAAKRGLWADLPATERQTPPSHFTCGGKTRCAEMSSCAEARFHLEHCGATKLDGDRDGVPCEAICR